MYCESAQTFSAEVNERYGDSTAVNRHWTERFDTLKPEEHKTVRAQLL